jgi:cytochrome c-type biogenesis protein CcmH/NrfG
MKREPVVFAVAGMVFGFVLGYMVASWDSGPRASSAGTLPSARAVAPGAASGPEGGGESALDANEVQALEAHAARDPSNVTVRKELGELYMDHSRYDEAARWYREAVALAPGQTDVLVDLGAALVNAGRPAEGLAEFEKALKLDPGHKKALFNKGVALLQTGRRSEAVAVWEGLLKKFPDDPQLQVLRDQIERVRAGKAS